MDLSKFIIPLGIATYAVLLLAILTGLRVIKVKVKWHKMIALIALIIASIHAIIVIYLNYF
ncbi:MAG: hypothetical protein OEZ20_07920 [candidate division WOR-3 bacterium]|nr:hypothetical protein [candidate division WOR-3 bacterium]MDH5684375.1 hypothetical protein [candidate division WOR-3 bacterium]